MSTAKRPNPAHPLTAKALLFDLDGTLVDSAPDLWGALNYCLKDRNIPTLELDQVRHLVGNGARFLLARGFWGIDAEPPEEGVDPDFESAV
ncbi:MAG: HAD hydrolase-like protein, partial [Magnetococcales bacterium]|nr:HAD hydrolase-like protein [Magnetococcales bacterium]